MIKFKQCPIKLFSNISMETKASAIDFLSENGEDIYNVVSELRKPQNNRAVSHALIGILKTAIGQVIDKQKVKAGMAASRKSFDNSYLEQTLKKLHYTKGYNYTVNEKGRKLNIAMIKGTFLVVAEKGNDSLIIDEEFYDSSRNSIRRAEIDKTVTYTYAIESRQQFEFLLKKLMSTKLTFNIFD